MNICGFDRRQRGHTLEALAKPGRGNVLVARTALDRIIICNVNEYITASSVFGQIYRASRFDIL